MYQFVPAWCGFRGVWKSAAAQGRVAAVALLALLPVVRQAWGEERPGEGILTLQPGDHICLIGNTLAERMQQFHHFETRLHHRFPTYRLVVRNLSWSADEINLQPRSLNFGDRDAHLRRQKADVILAFFGFNESFAGAAGLDRFCRDLKDFIDHTLRQTYHDNHPPRLVLLSPVAHENLGDPNLPDGTATNANLELYTRAMAEVATAEQVTFVDLFHPTKAAMGGDPPWTINGIHLNDYGYHRLAELLEHALFGAAGDAPPADLGALDREIARKNLWFWHRYRAVNGYYIYGGRSDLHQNREVMETERRKIDDMVAIHDRRIWELAQGRPVPQSADYGSTTRLLPVASNYTLPITYLSPEEARARFELAEGYDVNLFASEVDFPELANPTQITFDSRGRLWVSVMPSYPQLQPPHLPDDKLLILEDADNDGKADKCTVFARGLHLPTGFELGDEGVYVAAQPNLLFLKDTDGDDVADVRETVLHGFDSADSHHAISTFTWGPDGGLYFQEGTFFFTQVETPYGPTRCHSAGIYRYDPRTERLETFVSYPFANPWGHVFDRWGQNFIADASGGANYFGAALSGYLAYPEKHAEMQQLFPKRVRPTCGLEFVSSEHFPDSAQGNLLLNNVIGVQGVLQHVVVEEGSGFTCREIKPLLLSSDPNFRPVDLKFGLDGALYVCDWHNALIGHMQHSLRDPNRDRTHGRIWRVTYRNRPLLSKPEIDGAPLAELFDVLKSPDARTRYCARRELGSRPTADVIRALNEWLDSLDPLHPDYQQHRLEALWICQGHNWPHEELLREVLSCDEPRARAAATRAACFWRHQLPTALAMIQRQAADPHPRVRLEAVRAASYFHDAAALEIVLQVLEQPRDYYLDYTLRETLRALRPYWNPEEWHDVEPEMVHYLLRQLPPGDLLQLDHSPTAQEVLLGLEDVPIETRLQALDRLARLRHSDPARELLRVIGKFDSDTDTRRALVVQDLTRMLCHVRAEELAGERKQLVTMAVGGESAGIRRAGLAALVVVGQTADVVWQLASQRPAGVRDLLEALPMLADHPAAGPFFERALGLAHEADQSVRHAAVQAIAHYKQEPRKVFETLAQLVIDGIDLRAATIAMALVPQESWDVDRIPDVAARLLAYLAELDEQQRSRDENQLVMKVLHQMADKLAPAQQSELRDALRRLEVLRIEIGTIPHHMAFDRNVFVVEAGRAVELQFTNSDVMPHNLVIVAPGALQEVGTRAEQMALSPTGSQRGYVPDVASVLHATALIEPRQSSRLFFHAPEASGAYPYVCTYPGHWRRMYGAMLVVPDAHIYLANHPELPSADELLGIASPAYDWTLADLVGNVRDMSGRSFQRGVRLFAEASCISCHRIRGVGGQLGPELTDVTQRLKPEEILRAILEPSASIDSKYAALVLTTHDGQIARGSVIKETDSELHLVENPELECEPRVIAKDQINWEETAYSTISPMPEGLLNTLDRDAVLDLLAFVLAGGDPHHSLFGTASPNDAKDSD